MGRARGRKRGSVWSGSVNSGLEAGIRIGQNQQNVEIFACSRSIFPSAATKFSTIPGIDTAGSPVFGRLEGSRPEKR